jgi:hypothetical protein
MHVPARRILFHEEQFAPWDNRVQHVRAILSETLHRIENFFEAVVITSAYEKFISFVEKEPISGRIIFLWGLNSMLGISRADLTTVKTLAIDVSTRTRTRAAAVGSQRLPEARHGLNTNRCPTSRTLRIPEKWPGY